MASARSPPGPSSPTEPREPHWIRATTEELTLLAVIRPATRGRLTARRPSMRALYFATVSLHVLAAMFWFGGMFFLWIVGAPALRRVEPPKLRQRLFSNLELPVPRALGWGAVGAPLATLGAEPAAPGAGEPAPEPQAQHPGREQHPHGSPAKRAEPEAQGGRTAAAAAPAARPGGARARPRSRERTCRRARTWRRGRAS